MHDVQDIHCLKSYLFFYKKHPFVLTMGDSACSFVLIAVLGYSDEMLPINLLLRMTSSQYSHTYVEAQKHREQNLVLLQSYNLNAWKGSIKLLAVYTAWIGPDRTGLTKSGPDQTGLSKPDPTDKTRIGSKKSDPINSRQNSHVTSLIKDGTERSKASTRIGFIPNVPIKFLPSCTVVQNEYLSSKRLN